MKFGYDSKKDATITVLNENNDAHNLKKKDTLNLQHIKPENLCAYAFHTAFPYLLTFEQGGYFKWMRDKRKVIAQCPNPAVGVDMEISRSKIKVINVRGNCPNKHKIGDEFEVDLKKSNFCLSALATLFPYLSLVQFSNYNNKLVLSCGTCDNCNTRVKFEIASKSLNKSKSEIDILRNAIDEDICRICSEKSSTSIKVSSMLRPCIKYHKDNKTRYTLDTISPKGMCLAAYHAIYPYCLAILYGAKFNDKSEVCIKCPSPSNYVVFKIKKVPRKLKMLFDAVQKVSRLFHPLDIFPSDDIIIEVIENEGICPKKHVVNDVFRFNTKGFCEICPASFNQLYPGILLLKNNSRVPWSNKTGEFFGQCPDSSANITYGVNEAKNNV